MSYKNHSIFNQQKQTSDINKVFVKINSNGNWYFEKDKKYYNLSPAEITRISLPPIAAGADILIKYGCKLKNICYDKGVWLSFSDQEFLDYDVKLEYNNNLFDGWMYDLTSEKFKSENGQKIWVCGYINLFYKNPPKNLYIKMNI